ncbi:MAG: hypothetical protein AAFR17_08805 [Pseudomonadota bacterium]
MVRPALTATAMVAALESAASDLDPAALPEADFAAMFGDRLIAQRVTETGAIRSAALIEDP